MISKKGLFIIGALWLVITVFVSGCSQDYRPDAQGSNDAIMVVMDSTQMHSKTAQAIRHVFGGLIATLPRPVPRYTLNFANLNSNEVLKLAKQQKNVIFAAPIDSKSNTAMFIRSLLSKQVQQRVRDRQNFVFLLHNLWYQNQWTLILTSTSDDTLAKYIDEAAPRLLESLAKVTRKRYQNDIYAQDEQKSLEKKIWDEHGWKIRIEHDYRLHVDTTDFLTLQYYLPDNDRWIWVWSKDNVNNINFLDEHWVNATRDSLMKKYIRGTEDSSYVTTAYNRPMVSRTLMMNGYYTMETKGLWQMTHDAMGGPFINYTIYVPEQRRLYMLEFDEFAPKYGKRSFVRQFEAMGWTFQADTTLTPQDLARLEEKQREKLKKQDEAQAKKETKSKSK